MHSELTLGNFMVSCAKSWRQLSATESSRHWKRLLFCSQYQTIIRSVIPVVFKKLTTVQCMYLSNTTLFDGRGISSIYYIRYNYMFRHLTMAIFRLYIKYLVSSYTRLNMGCIQWGGRSWGGHEFSYVSWKLRGVGTRGICYCMYIWVNNS